jgi:hypothetical protein
LEGILLLSFGYERPENTCTGDVWFPAMERNIQRMNDHTHDGVNAGFIAANIGQALAANWGVDLGGGSYKQLLTLPDGMTFDHSRIEVRRSTGEVAYPTIVKSTDTAFYLYTNDNSLSYNLSYV